MANDDIIVVRIAREHGGLFLATSQHLAGVCVTHRDARAIIDDTPNIIRLWFKRHKGLDVEVFP